MKRKVKMKKTGLLVGFILVIGMGILIYCFMDNDSKEGNNLISKPKEKEITDFENLSFNDANDYAKKKKYEVKTTYDYNDSIEKDKVISGNIENNILNLVVSLGSIPIETFKEKKVNE